MNISDFEQALVIRDQLWEEALEAVRTAIDKALEIEKELQEMKGEIYIGKEIRK